MSDFLGLLVRLRSPLAIKKRPHRITGALHVGHDELHHLAQEWPVDLRVVAYCV